MAKSNKTFGPEYMLTLALGWAAVSKYELDTKRLCESLVATFGKIEWTRSSVSVRQSSVTFRSSGSVSETLRLREKNGAKVPLTGAYAFVAYAHLCWQAELLDMMFPPINDAAAEYLQRFAVEPPKS